MDIIQNFVFYMQSFSEILEGKYGTVFETIAIALFVVVFNFIISAVLLKLKEKFLKEKKLWLLSFVTALYKPLNYFVWFLAAMCSVDIISTKVFSIHFSHLHEILSVGCVLAFGWFLLRWNWKIVEFMIRLSYSHEITMTRSKLDIISKLVTIGIFIVTVFLLMDVTGRNMQTIIAFGGIGGLAIAFASQQVIQNFFGGVMIYTTQPFTVGEEVSLPENDIQGIIEEIGWYSTRIRNMEKRPIYVPNSIFTQTVVMTPSRKTHERFHHKIGLRHEDINHVKEVVDEVKAMLIAHRSVDKDHKIEVFFIGFGEASLDIEISAYIELEHEVFQAIQQELLFSVASIMKKHGAKLATHVCLSACYPVANPIPLSHMTAVEFPKK